MKALSGHTDFASLLIEGSVTSFVFGTTVLVVPSECAERCTLIEELRQQAQYITSVPLPFPEADLAAWLDCSSSRLDVVAHHRGCVTIFGSRRRTDRTLTDVNALARALEVADFLHDAETVDFVTQVFAALVLAEPELDIEREAPSEILSCQQLDATKAMRAVPERFVVDVLKHMDLSYNGGVLPFHRRRNGRQLIWILLRLLPRDFHAAIFQAWSDDPDQPGSFTVGPFSPYHHVPPKVKRNRGRVRMKKPKPDSADGEEHATPTFQLLAAAASLAGGSAERAWAPGAVAALTAANVGRKRKPRRKRASRAKPEVSAASDSGTLTRLHVHLPAGEHAKEPPRWCAALAELRTLKELTVTATNVLSLSGPEFTAALRSLTALEKLTINCHGVTYCIREPSPDLPAMLFPAMMQLVDGVSELTQLSSLALQQCLSFPPVVPPTDGCAIAQLSRLTRLTTLSLERSVFNAEWNGVLSGAVKSMHALRELRLGASKDASRAGGAVEALAADLCTCTQLTALRSIGVEDLSKPAANQSGDDHHLQIGRLHQHVAEVNPALLQRLTGLHLRDAASGAQQSGELVALLKATPALQSLSLCGTARGNFGLVRIAAALPQLTALTRLDIGGNAPQASADSMCTGVLSVLNALLEPGAAGHARLHGLHIWGNPVASDEAGAVTALLPRLRGLQELDVSGVQYAEHGAVALAQAFAGLPQLTSAAIWSSQIRDDILARRCRKLPDVPCVGMRPIAEVLAALAIYGDAKATEDPEARANPPAVRDEYGMDHWRWRILPSLWLRSPR